MDHSSELQEQIDQYLNGQLTGPALQQFESILQNDPNLQKEVAFQKEIHSLLEDSPENALRKNLQQLGEEFEESTDTQNAGISWLLPLDFLREKLFGHPVANLAWVIPLLLTVGWWFRGSETITETNPSIAVLPFSTTEQSGQNNYLGTGLAEELLHSLAQVRELSVAGQTYSFSLDTDNLNWKNIREKLRVNHVLTGSIDRREDQILVTAQLVNLADGQTVWSDKYERPVDNIFSIQEDLLQQVATQLIHSLSPMQLASLQSVVPAQGPVYDLFLKAKYLHQNRYKSTNNLDDFRASEALFLEAIELDSTYAPARAGLADLYDSYWVQIQLQEGNSERAYYQQLMDKESQMAVQLAPENAYVNRVRGYVLHHLQRPEAAYQRFLKSYEISPRNPESLMGLSNLYLGFGMHEDALSFAEEAKRLDPLFSSAWVMEIIANYYLGFWEKTVTVCQEFLEIDSDNQTALEYLFRSHFMLRQTEQAEVVLQKITHPELLGLDLEIALLKGDSAYLESMLNIGNPNLDFTIHTFRGATEAATSAYQKATVNYLAAARLDTTLQNSFYLDFINDPRLQRFQSEDWFQEVIALEKEKFQQLREKYPPAEELMK